MLVTWKSQKNFENALVFQTSVLQSSQYSDKTVAISQIVFTVSKGKP